MIIEKVPRDAAASSPAPHQRAGDGKARSVTEVFMDFLDFLWLGAMGCGASGKLDADCLDLVTGRDAAMPRNSSMESRATRVPPVLDFSQLPPVWAHQKHPRGVLTQEVQASTSSFSPEGHAWKLKIGGL